MFSSPWFWSLFATCFILCIILIILITRLKFKSKWIVLISGFGTIALCIAFLIYTLVSKSTSEYTHAYSIFLGANICNWAMYGLLVLPWFYDKHKEKYWFQCLCFIVSICGISGGLINLLCIPFTDWNKIHSIDWTNVNFFYYYFVKTISHFFILLGCFTMLYKKWFRLRINYSVWTILFLGFTLLWGFMLYKLTGYNAMYVHNGMLGGNDKILYGWTVDAIGVFIFFIICCIYEYKKIPLEERWYKKFKFAI